MHTNQAKTDVKLMELTETIEKTHLECEEPTSAGMNAWQEETTACHEAMEPDIEKIKADSGMMEFEVEHREAPEEDTIVKPVEGQNKQHRGQKQAAGRHGEPKELNRGICGSQKKLAAAWRKVSCHATVAWHKRKILRKSWTQGNCGLRQEFAASRKYPGTQ
jgi:hypothetical protein